MFFSSPLFKPATAEILHKHKLSCNLNLCLILLFMFVQLSRKWKIAIETKIIFVAGCAFKIYGDLLSFGTNDHLGNFRFSHMWLGFMF